MTNPPVKIPARPEGETPTIVSTEVQDILYYAVSEAECSLLVQLYGEGADKGMKWISLGAELHDRMRKGDLAVKVEYYHLIVHFINRATLPHSRKGISVDRFEARQHIWDQLFS